MIEQAYRVAQGMGIAGWCEDEAGPFQTLPYPAPSWQPEEHPQHQAHEDGRDGTAKILRLFHPHDGQVRVKGVERATHAVLHPWLQGQLIDILRALPEVSSSEFTRNNSPPGAKVARRVNADVHITETVTSIAKATGVS